MKTIQELIDKSAIIYCVYTIVQWIHFLMNIEKYEDRYHETVKNAVKNGIYRVRVPWPFLLFCLAAVHLLQKMFS